MPPPQSCIGGFAFRSTMVLDERRTKRLTIQAQQNVSKDADVGSMSGPQIGEHLECLAVLLQTLVGIELWSPIELSVAIFYWSIVAPENATPTTPGDRPGGDAMHAGSRQSNG